MNRLVVYLWPTQLWVIVGPIMVCLWMAAVNYNNNLIYALFYLVLSLSFLSIFFTWRNLLHLQIEQVLVKSNFAGREIELEIHLRNVSRHDIYFLQLIPLESTRWFEKWLLSSKTLNLGQEMNRGLRCFKAGDARSFIATLPPKVRGVYPFYALEIRSNYPFGLFWSIRRFFLNATVYVYPDPKGNLEWPATLVEGDDGQALSLRPGDDFYGVRPYLPGESLRRVDWKAYARGRPLMVKQFLGGSQEALALNVEEVSGEWEARLSQLAQWVLEAEQTQKPFSLRLGKKYLDYGAGPLHTDQALRMLAAAKAK